MQPVIGDLSVVEDEINGIFAVLSIEAVSQACSVISRSEVRSSGLYVRVCFAP